MNKDEMVKLITTKIEDKVGQAHKTSDWNLAKASVMQQIVDGIADGVGTIAEDIKANMVPKEKINEMIGHINMLERYMRLINPLVTLPIEADKLGTAPNSIKPLT